jgi:hypothetical protein
MKGDYDRAVADYRNAIALSAPNDPSYSETLQSSKDAVTRLSASRSKPAPSTTAIPEGPSPVDPKNVSPDR